MALEGRTSARVNLEFVAREGRWADVPNTRQGQIKCQGWTKKNGTVKQKCDTCYDHRQTFFHVEF